MKPTTYVVPISNFVTTSRNYMHDCFDEPMTMVDKDLAVDNEIANIVSLVHGNKLILTDKSFEKLPLYRHIIDLNLGCLTKSDSELLYILDVRDIRRQLISEDVLKKLTMNSLKEILKNCGHIISIINENKFDDDMQSMKKLYITIQNQFEK